MMIGSTRIVELPPVDLADAVSSAGIQGAY